MWLFRCTLSWCWCYLWSWLDYSQDGISVAWSILTIFYSVYLQWVYSILFKFQVLTEYPSSIHMHSGSCNVLTKMRWTASRFSPEHIRPTSNHRRIGPETIYHLKPQLRRISQARICRPIIPHSHGSTEQTFISTAIQKYNCVESIHMGQWDVDGSDCDVGYRIYICSGLSMLNAKSVGLELIESMHWSSGTLPGYCDCEYCHGCRTRGPAMFVASECAAVSLETVSNHVSDIQQACVSTTGIGDLCLSSNSPYSVCVAAGIEVHYTLKMLRSPDISCRFSLQAVYNFITRTCTNRCYRGEHKCNSMGPVSTYVVATTSKQSS